MMTNLPEKVFLVDNYSNFDNPQNFSLVKQ